MSRGLGKPVAFWKMLHFLLTRGRHAATPRRNPPTCWKAARSFLLINRKLEDLELEKGLSFTGCHSSKENGKIPAIPPREGETANEVAGLQETATATPLHLSAGMPS